MSSNPSIRRRTVLLWVLVLSVALSCGVQAAPEAFHHRQGEPAVVYPPSTLNDLEELGLNDSPDDTKHQEEMLRAYLQFIKNEMQRQNIDEDPNGLDSGPISTLDGLPNMPLPAALQAKLFRSQDGVNKEDIKRGSYQPSLCYFKICNMGRKRNSR